MPKNRTQQQPASYASQRQNYNIPPINQYEDEEDYYVPYFDDDEEEGYVYSSYQPPPPPDSRGRNMQPPPKYRGQGSQQPPPPVQTYVPPKQQQPKGQNLAQRAQQTTQNQNNGYKQPKQQQAPNNNFVEVLIEYPIQQDVYVTIPSGMYYQQGDKDKKILHIQNLNKNSRIVGYYLDGGFFDIGSKRAKDLEKVVDDNMKELQKAVLFYLNPPEPKVKVDKQHIDAVVKAVEELRSKTNPAPSWKIQLFIFSLGMFAALEFLYILISSKGV